jgi:hypothetical protein
MEAQEKNPPKMWMCFNDSLSFTDFASKVVSFNASAAILKSWQEQAQFFLSP